MDTSSGFRRFLALLYKGMLLRKRNFCATAFEIIFTVVLASVPAIIFSKNIPEEMNGDKVWVNDSVHYPFSPFTSGPSNSNVVYFGYVPSNPITDKLMKDALQIWESNQRVCYVYSKGFESDNELENFFLLQQYGNETINAFVGTIFNNIKAESSAVPSSLDYTIRHSSNDSTGFSTNLKHRFSQDPNRDDMYSSRTYFLSWQASVEKAFIQLKMKEENETFEYEIWMQEFPSPGYKKRNFNGTFFGLDPLPLMFICAFFISTFSVIESVIEEKSNGSKELMKMMGMTDFVYWSSTFTNHFIVGAIVMMIVTIIYKSPLKHSAVFLQHSDFVLIYIILLLFMASLILICLTVTTFFNRAVFGLIAFFTVYDISYILLSSFVFIMNDKEANYYALSVFVKFCICLIPTGALLSAIEIILVHESIGDGVRWYNLSNTDAIPEFSVLLLIIAMIFSCFLYTVLIWYIDAVWPWQYGVPKPFYFPFTKSYWCGHVENKLGEAVLNSTHENKNAEFFEDDPTGVLPGVVINNLSKVFRNGSKVAVNNISLKIYNGQITALLGHNGAGKTTTINILTGLYLPSSGTVSINGWDISSQTAKAREFIGVCPQHNLLYDDLTVEEHLKLYAVMKGVSWNQLNKEIEAVLGMVYLTDKKTELVKNLSGGMKRKLSLGIAVIGGSKVLFLDEPTSGLDVESRRNVWDALLNMRHNCTIILTTQYMEEADILGDRIAIMANGEIQCCGSSLFLKKKFGTGYHLHLVKRDNFDLNAVQDILLKYVPTAILENEYEEEVTFNLMLNTHSNFASLFEEIELNQDTLGVNSFGLSVTTLEDVLFNVSKLADIKMKNQVDLSLQNAQNADEMEMKESNEFGKSHQFTNKVIGLFLKRLHYAKRYWSIIVSQLLLPFVFLCICLSMIQSKSYVGVKRDPSLKLDVEEVYGKTDGFYTSDNDTLSKSFEVNIQKIFKEKNVNAKFEDDPEKYILNNGRKSIAKYYKQLIIGGSVKLFPGEVKKLNLTAWYNGYPYHAEPMSLALMDTIILRSLNKSGYITVTNHPLPWTEYHFLKDPFHLRERITASEYIPLALSFLTASFVMVPIHERAADAKLLQMMTGISAGTYWLSMFLWDFLISTIVSIFLIIPFAIFSHYAFFYPHSDAIGSAVLLLIFYGWSSIPFAYLFSLLFKNANTAFSVVLIICVLGGTVLSMIFTVILIPSVVQNLHSVQIAAWFLKLIPSFSVAIGFGNLFAIAYENAYCESLTPKDLKYKCMHADPSNPILQCCKDICGDKCLNQTYPITMDEKGVGRDILFLFLDGILYFLLLLFLESSAVKLFLRRNLQKVGDNQLLDNSVIEDSDVLQEEERIRSNFEQVSQNDALVVLNLTKVFKTLKAVDRLTFGIHRKECFGLLGVNGAGKTTTLRMLTGECFPTNGNAYIDSYSVTRDLKKFQSYLGYCPQFNALINRLSAREMITLFARLRGINGAIMTRYVNALIKMTDLTQYADKPSKVYSGGNKRKLSIALALIGAPPLLLLDEPTVGVDPISRRKIWKILSLARTHSGAAVILTTHSMEESETVCRRLAILVNGRFRCLGSIQHLKSKFSQGYILIIKMKKEEQSNPQSVIAVKAYIDTKLHRAQLKDDHQGILQYHIVNPSVKLSQMFRFMDEMKQKCNLEDYMLSDTSLEQIFLAFSQSQRMFASL